jgi:hypothetical protein
MTKTASATARAPKLRDLSFTAIERTAIIVVSQAEQQLAAQ